MYGDHSNSEYCQANFFYFVWIYTGISVLYLYLFLSSFILRISEPILSFPIPEFFSLFDYCCPCILVRLMCWPISSYPDIGNLLLALIPFDEGDICWSITVCRSLGFVVWPQNPYNWPFFGSLQSLIGINIAFPL